MLYYAPVAEMVVGLSQQREGLPQIRQLRLSHKTAHARQRSTEQEVRVGGRGEGMVGGGA